MADMEWHCSWPDGPVVADRSCRRSGFYLEIETGVNASYKREQVLYFAARSGI